MFATDRHFAQQAYQGGDAGADKQHGNLRIGRQVEAGVGAAEDTEGAGVIQQPTGRGTASSAPITFVTDLANAQVQTVFSRGRSDRIGARQASREQAQQIFQSDRLRRAKFLQYVQQIGTVQVSLQRLALADLQHSLEVFTVGKLRQFA